MLMFIFILLPSSLSLDFYVHVTVYIFMYTFLYIIVFMFLVVILCSCFSLYYCIHAEKISVTDSGEMMLLCADAIFRDIKNSKRIAVIDTYY